MTHARRGFHRAHRWLDRMFAEYGAEAQVITGAILIAVSIVLVAVALQVRDQTTLGVRACEHSREFGPYIARDYDRRHVLPDSVQARYEASIPRRCR